MLVNSLTELNLNEKNFPLFFWDEYLLYEKLLTPKGNVFIYYHEILKGLIVFKTTKLKLIQKGQFLFAPRDYEGKEINEEIESQLFEEFFLFLKRKKLADIFLSPIHFSHFKTFPTKCSYFKLGLIQISQLNEIDIFLKLKPNYRNEIRKLLYDENIKIIEGTHLIEKSYKLIKSTLSEQGLFISNFNEFELAKKYLNKNTYVSICEIEGVPFGTVIFQYDKETAYYLYSGNNKNNEYPGVNKLLIFHALEFFKTLGIKNVILGGYREEHLASAKVIGIQKFKLRFGAEIVNGFHFIKVINPFKYAMFNLLLKLKSFITSKNLDLINLKGFNVQKNN